ncbi:MAG: shikimate dehydrogenase [Acidobacteria bacterium]|nr:shikimate dehydrogenase [Acidobacteriota bacterium]
MARPALPRICISVTGETPNALLESAERALQSSRFVELRLDWLPRPDEGLSLVPRLLARACSGAEAHVKRNPVLQATCRRTQNGGRFRGTVAEQIRVLQQAIVAGCRAVDVEIESAESAGAEALDPLRDHATLILSWHDFDSTPKLDTAARRLRKFDADYYKLVPTAVRQSDNCAVLDFLKRSQTQFGKRRWVVFCMEQAGAPSRVLALSRGSAFVYASPTANDDARTIAAPGQIDYATLRNVFRAEKLTSDTALYGLLGFPIGHSVGAAIHNAAFRARKLDSVYLPLLASDLADFRKAAAGYPLSGFSVTIPHKQAIFRLLDKVDPIAKAARATNTVRIRRGRWEGINSDVEGIVVPLRKEFSLAKRGRLEKNFRALVVGTGGAARAALVALRDLHCRNVLVAGRNVNKARILAAEFGGMPLAITRLSEEYFDLLIHATSVGMWPRQNDCLLRPEQLHADIVFDLVYNPPDTRLLQMARALGSRTVSGLEMFLAQAARQFEYWTGTEAPRKLMRATAERELARFGKTVTSDK